MEKEHQIKKIMRKNVELQSKKFSQKIRGFQPKKDEYVPSIGVALHKVG
jgi:hypothetical protein